MHWFRSNSWFIKRSAVWFNSFKPLKNDKYQSCQFPWRVVNSLKTWKSSKRNVLTFKHEAPGIFPVCPMVNPALVKRCNYCKAVIAKLQSSGTVQVALRDISLRTLFLNRVCFDLRESADISFLNTYVNERFVQWRWSESLWQKRLLCSITVAKSSFFVIQLSVWTN